MKVVTASGAPLAWDVIDDVNDALTPAVLNSIKRTGVALKGDFVAGTRRGEGVFRAAQSTQCAAARSRAAVVPGIGRGTKPPVHIELNRKLGLYANVVHSLTLPGACSRSVPTVCLAQQCTPTCAWLVPSLTPWPAPCLSAQA